MTVLVEAAVESLDDALRAIDGGADRLELCADLDAGGTTPGRTLIADVVARTSVPVLAMIRPRGGSFAYTRAELLMMQRDIAMVSDFGVAGIVLGVLNSENRVDAAATSELVEVAGALPVTFHRAIDLAPELLDALDLVATLGVSRVLTSGGAQTAGEGMPMLARMVHRAGDRLSIVAGGGVRAANVRHLVERSGVREVHARCGSDAARVRAIRAALAPDRGVRTN